MKIACIYTVERCAIRSKPLHFSMDISYGIAIISTLLKDVGHDVQLFVFSSKSSYIEQLQTYIVTQQPKLFCLTAVSTQYPFICEIARLVKNIDPTLFVILGGHHASLDSKNAIKESSLDAICIGEGESSVVELAYRIENSKPITNIPNLWIKQADGILEKNPRLPFKQDLDNLPYIDRKMWEPWINEPHLFFSILLGRGCPFRCTYCSNHVLRRLSSGRYTRFRSPENIIGEIDYICTLYPNVNRIWLEVETIHYQDAAFALFEKLEEFNRSRNEKICFGLNFSVTSAFIKDTKRCTEFFEMLKKANVVYLQVGLESGSERLRREVLKRPNYTNEEFIQFSRITKEYDIDLTLYVLMGVPEESLEDYKKTLRLVRHIQPSMVVPAIFYPYIGTNLYNAALEQGLICRGNTSHFAERARVAIDLPDFPRQRVRLEYVLFMFKVYKGAWPMSKIFVLTIKGLINGSYILWSIYLYFKEHSKIYKLLRSLYRYKMEKREKEEQQRNVHYKAHIE